MPHMITAAIAASRMRPACCGVMRGRRSRVRRLMLITASLMMSLRRRGQYASCLVRCLRFHRVKMPEACGENDENFDGCDRKGPRGRPGPSKRRTLERFDKGCHRIEPHEPPPLQGNLSDRVNDGCEVHPEPEDVADHETHVAGAYLVHGCEQRKRERQQQDSNHENRRDQEPWAPVDIPDTHGDPVIDEPEKRDEEIEYGLHKSRHHCREGKNDSREIELRDEVTVKIETAAA